MQDQKDKVDPDPAAVKMGLLKDNKNDPPGDDEPPPNKSRFNNLNLFIFNLVILNMARMALKMYLGGSVRTIERRFGLRSSTTGLLFSLTDIMHLVLVLLFGHFGRTGHKPRMIAITSIFPAVAGLLMAAPYFILPSPGYGTDVSTGNSTSGSSTDAQLCDAALLEDENCDTAGMSHATQNNIALGFFLVASILTGVAGPSTITLGIPYMDENSTRAKTAMGVGLVIVSFSMGPILGLLLASACTRLPENLKATDMEPTDPNFIGAWWLGFGVGGILVLILGIPMFFYPKHMTAKAAAIAKEASKAGEEHSEHALWHKVKAIPLSIVRLFKKKAYVTLVVSDLFTIFVVMGIFWNLPRYMEIHFLMPAYLANVVGAMSSAGMGLLGGLLGGAIMSKLKLKLLGTARLLLLCSGSVLLLATAVLFIRCPKVEMDGEFDVEAGGFSPTTTCNRNCSCLADKRTYMPVCGSGGDLTYFSPCHAGCTLSANGTFHDCSCTEAGTTEAGLCLETCKLYLPFAVALGLISLAGGIGKPAHIIAVMRVVSDQDRPLAIGFNSFAVNLIGLLPGPIFFGYMIDSACDLWQNICGESGECLFYDTDKFRWRTYGVCVLFICANFFFLVLFFFLVRRKKPADDRPTDDDGEKDKEAINLDSKDGF